MQTRRLKSIWVICAMALAYPAFADTYVIDAVHSTAMFKIEHMGVSFTYGRFNDLSGELVYNVKSPSEGASIHMDVKTASIDTASALRDEHLRGQEFFDVERYPSMSFRSASWKQTGEKSFELTGDFTLLGVTKTISIPVTFVGAGKGMKGEDRIGFTTVFHIKRSDYGMDKLIGPVGDDVEITVALEAVRQTEASETPKPAA